MLHGLVTRDNVLGGYLLVIWHLQSKSLNWNLIVVVNFFIVHRLRLYLHYHYLLDLLKSCQLLMFFFRPRDGGIILILIKRIRQGVGLYGYTTESQFVHGHGDA